MLRNFRSKLAAGLTVAFLTAGVATAAPVILPQTIATGFGATEWYVGYSEGSAAPFSGSCSDVPSFGLDDADGPTGAGDAYDGAWTIFVNGAVFAAPEGIVDLTGTTLTAGPVSMSGLQVTVQHFYALNSAVARFVVSLNNPGAVAVPATIQVPVNFGSDGGTVIQSTSSGDAVVSTADRWVVSSDGGPGDPVNTTVMYGPGTPQVTPASYTQTVFNCAGTNGLGATFNLTIPAGATRSLMFFAGLGGVTVNDNTIASAQAAAALFNSTATLPVEWLSGLSGIQKSQIANWSFLPTFTTCAAEGFFGGRLSLCHKICETVQTPSNFAIALKLYRLLYKTDPPCAL